MTAGSILATAEFFSNILISQGLVTSECPPTPLTSVFSVAQWWGLLLYQRWCRDSVGSRFNSQIKCRGKPCKIRDGSLESGRMGNKHVVKHTAVGKIPTCPHFDQSRVRREVSKHPIPTDLKCFFCFFSVQVIIIVVVDGIGSSSYFLLCLTNLIWKMYTLFCMVFECYKSIFPPPYIFLTNIHQKFLIFSNLF